MYTIYYRTSRFRFREGESVSMKIYRTFPRRRKIVTPSTEENIGPTLSASLYLYHASTISNSLGSGCHDVLFF